MIQAEEPRAEAAVTRTDGKHLWVDGRQWRAQGVTYGNFGITDTERYPKPAVEVVSRWAQSDLASIRGAGALLAVVETIALRKILKTSIAAISLSIEDLAPSGRATEAWADV